MDDINRRILHWLQRDAAMPVAELAERAGISASPCWRRVQRLQDSGVIRARVALLDAKQVNVGVNVFVSVRTNQHRKEWADAFCRVVMSLPEVVGSTAWQARSITCCTSSCPASRRMTRSTTA